MLTGWAVSSVLHLMIASLMWVEQKMLSRCVRFFVFCASKVGMPLGSAMSSSYLAIKSSRGWAAVRLLLKRWWLFVLSQRGWWRLKSLSSIMPSVRLVLWLLFRSLFLK